MTKKEAFLNQARSWLGYNEDDGSYKKIIDVYNAGLAANVKRWGTRNIRMAYEWEWCSCFVSACAIAVGADGIVPIEIACTSHRAIAQRFGIWQENDAYVPAAGDLILYDWDDSGSGDNRGSEDHIGIVEYVEGSTIHTIEGNGAGYTDASGKYHGKVYRNTRQVNGRYLRGFITPKWPSEPAPEPKPDPEPTPKEIVHTVVKGDTLWAIAKRYLGSGARYPEIAKYNGIENANLIYVGQKIRIPGTAPAPDPEPTPKEIVHTVVRGDTLWAIAKKYLGSGARYPEIAKYNGIKNANLIYVGQKIRIPQ